ncbi:hypothetical protein QWZ14_04235 [Paeniroseomonas aquatica]|uniref:Uncharacterized protein n=1 Tax=Paeniroseomonas aquatica TaxID=373043 RepID=A0ABT8A1G4_9PROT|nr:hypothetical protein [Paeniroseomonas aquatica]MDN3563582.1 hypothetical protein [Paeniroseomonas aquatica]
MLDHIIIAHEAGSAPNRFFLGYRDNGSYCEIAWTSNPWEAVRMEPSEAAIEARRIATLCPDFLVHSWCLPAEQRPNQNKGG